MTVRINKDQLREVDIQQFIEDELFYTVGIESIAVDNDTYLEFEATEEQYDKLEEFYPNIILD